MTRFGAIHDARKDREPRARFGGHRQLPHRGPWRYARPDGVVVLSALRFRPGVLAPAGRQRGEGLLRRRRGGCGLLRGQPTCATRRSCRPSSAMARAMPCRSPTSRRASSATSGCSTRRRSSAASSRWPVCPASRSGCGRPSTTAASRASRAIGSNHMRFSGGTDALRLTTDAAHLLHRARDVVRAHQAGDADPGARRTVRGGR